MSSSILLVIAIVSEVAGTIALRSSDGFSRLAPSAVVVVAYALSFWLLARVLRDLDVGLVYAVWAGAGTALVAGIGMLAFDEPATALRLGCIGLIIAGVAGLNLAGGH